MAQLPSDTPAVISLTSQWLVCYKPAGWLTIPATASDATNPKLMAPGEKSWMKTPLGVLSEWAKERYSNVWVVHRIDRETSGLVLFARTPQDHRLANTWFQAHEVKKMYDCIASGIPSAPVFKVKTPVQGAPSTTQVEVKETYEEGFLASVFPVTGRRHQIRIHLASVGNPLWGDRLYKGPAQVILGDRPMGIARVALHASRLELPTKEVFEAYWPKDFKAWVERLRTEGKRYEGS